MEIDPRHGDYLPVNQYNVLRENLPDAELVFTKGFLHELLSIHSAEELDCVRKAGKLCQNAMDGDGRARQAGREGIRAARGGRRRHPGRRRRHRLSHHRLDADGKSGAWCSAIRARPAACSKKGDIINMELAAGYRGYTAQIGSPICLGEPTEMVRKFWDEITLPGYQKIIAEIAPGKPLREHAHASKFFRDKGVQSRPTQCHGIDLVTDKPHISAEHVSAEAFETVLKPGMIIMAEPNPITADGMFGIFLGHTFIVTDDGHEVVDEFPLEIAVSRC